MAVNGQDLNANPSNYQSFNSFSWITNPVITSQHNNNTVLNRQTDSDMT